MTTDTSPMNCIHAINGVCPACQTEQELLAGRIWRERESIADAVGFWRGVCVTEPRRAFWQRLALASWATLAGLVAWVWWTR